MKTANNKVILNNQGTLFHLKGVIAEDSHRSLHIEELGSLVEA
ncbi:hypothetical protein OCO53_23810 [Peribacillus frigoritolerans]|nr:hypothetical protein [Peribacillus frigoritolerans]